MNVSSVYYVQFFLDDYLNSDARRVFILWAYVWKNSTLQVFNFRVVHKLFYQFVIPMKIGMLSVF